MALSRARGASSTVFTALTRQFSAAAASTPTNPFGTEHFLTHDITARIGSCMPLSLMRIGTIVHNLEIRPGEGAKLVRSAGTSAKILKIPNPGHVLIRLPSGEQKLVDSRCRATIGTVSNPSHGARKLRKAGQNRWRGWRPEVRGVAMNPIDHPHGGGEGKSKGNHPMTPWGKPTKSGYKTAPPRRRKKTYSV